MSDSSSCGSILVADDDDAVRGLLVDLLNRAGYEVEEAASGTAAIETIERERPRLAVLDVVMPGISGYEVCRRIRERHGVGVPVLFVSGQRVEPHDRAAGLLLGGDDYVVKPFSPDELLARIVSLLRRAGEPRPAIELTRRERDVLVMLGEGLHRGEIAQALVISPKTVNAHLGRIYEKLGVRDRVQAVVVAYRTGLLER